MVRASAGTRRRGTRCQRRIFSLGAALTLALAGGASAQTYRVVKSFNGTDGGSPAGNLVLAGSTLYGTTEGGGSSGHGVVFRVNTDGTGYGVLKDFTGSDGQSPQAGLALDGDTLFGTTSGGGSLNLGVVFKLNTNGTGYTVLKSFGLSEGYQPGGGLVLADGVSHGTLWSGGTSSEFGVVFKLNADGSGYEAIKGFDGGDGTRPREGLVLEGNTLFGTTESGGGSDDGTIFRVHTDGTGYAVVKTFTGTDGRMPYAGLALNGTTLYGTTFGGGDLDCGVVFSLTLFPVIEVPPHSQTVGSGVAVELSATVSNATAYQWLFNATNPIPGATNPVLHLAHVQRAQSGAYAVIVTNAFGAVTSAPALLQVASPVVANPTEADLRAALAQAGRVIVACDGTITLAGTIVVTNDTTLDATGHQVILSGSGAVRPFCVGSNTTLTLLNLTIANGVASDGQGGAILNAGGTLNATNCAFTGNLATNATGGPAQGGAIFNTNGQVALDRCIFTGNAARGANTSSASTNCDAAGGAVYSSGTVTARLCTFAGNSAAGSSTPTWTPGSGPPPLPARGAPVWVARCAALASWRSQAARSPATQ